eukprot:scaffold6808_cov21-Tisochrysis_lutea.AAC.1
MVMKGPVEVKQAGVWALLLHVLPGTPSPPPPFTEPHTLILPDIGVYFPAQEKFGVSLRILSSFQGSVLDGCQYRHPLADRLSPVVVGGDYITTDAGTGLVHTAPGHGQEDYQVGASGGVLGRKV